MALDFLKHTPREKYSLFATISDLEVSMLEIPIFEFKNKTGIYIDPYGKTHLHSDYIEILYSLILNHENTIMEDGKRPFKNSFDNVKSILTKAIEEKVDLVAIGD